jgi:Tol biopolymer transport system component
MGDVYRARDTRLGRDVALKSVRLDADRVAGESGERGRVRILREARTASKLHHPNICTIYDVGEDRGEAWIAMELVEGESLSAVVRRGALPPEVVVRHGIQIADALDHAHASGIVHRDLKPANVVIGADGRVKLLDFGIAARLPQDTAAEASVTTESVAGWSGPLAGTVPYMAPETLRGDAPGTGADLWALGVVLYELSSGRRPFAGDTSVDLVSAILTQPFAPLPVSVPPPLAAAIERLLQKDPALRFRSAGEVRAVLEGLATDAVQARATVAADGRRRWRWIAAALGLAVVAGGVWWWASRDRTLVLRDHQLLSTLAGSYRSPTFSPDGSLVAYVAPDANGVRQIWVRDFTEGKPVQITTGELHASRPRWSPANDQIYFARAGAGLWSVPRLGGTATRLIDAGQNPSVSSDGTRLVYERGREVWIANADGSQPHKVEGVPAQYYSTERRPAISPDGRWIVVFRAEAGPNGDLWLVPSAGGEARRLTFDTREGGSPAWTPDGRRIVFSSARAGSRTLWQIPVAGGQPEPLTTGSGDDDEPEVSRDGKRLVYTNVKRSWSLRFRDAASAEPRTLLEKHTELIFPIFSPDGTRLVFFGRQDRAVSVSSIRTDGSDVRQLTGGTELNHMPVWSADGASVYFFQIQPTLSFRRVSAEGGPSESVQPWNWEVQNAPRFDPAGRRLAYTRLGKDEATIIRDVETGAERTLPVLYRPTWSPDGRWVTGWHDPGVVARCNVDENKCTDVAPGIHARFGPNGATIWFLRLIPRSLMCELWSVDVASGREQPRGQLGPFRGIDRHFDLSMKGALAWAPMTEGLPELWAARLRK